ncbi:hypothetical protein [Roseitranquillus sediminis]|uniref:hypothetical protein n=1 Tax=Roseitranquillus sediminis TaxID=2809051 RepID=UPI001D0C22BC|nr:hypothetical protein [Roseitranquillus sediminis]MBM9596006.1 hypothetical protein [Roseitranquillus sediminis]
MFEVKERLNLVNRAGTAISQEKSFSGTPALDPEIVFLNFRKILELTMMGLAVAYDDFGVELQRKIVTK